MFLPFFRPALIGAGAAAIFSLPVVFPCRRELLPTFRADCDSRFAPVPGVRVCLVVLHPAFLGAEPARPPDLVDRESGMAEGADCDAALKDVLGFVHIHTSVTRKSGVDAVHCDSAGWPEHIH